MAKKPTKGKQRAAAKPGKRSVRRGQEKDSAESTSRPSRKSDTDKAKTGNTPFGPGTRFLCKVVRKSLGLTQREMAEYLGVSKKTIESYEQRWRKTPINVERLALLYLGCFKLAQKDAKIECWRMTDCPKARRDACVVYQVKRGDLCWMFGGSGACDEASEDWSVKLERCTRCKVLRAVLE